MKVCLYLELESILGVSGIGSAVNNQRRALELNGVLHTSDLEDAFDIIHINSIGLKSREVAKKMRKKGCKVVIHAHTTAEDFRDSYRFSNQVAPALKMYLRHYYHQADLVLCPSEYTKGVLQSYGVKTEIKVISNGVDIDRFRYSAEKRERFRKENGLDGVVPFNVGHLFLRKGLTSFLDVAKKTENNFVWVGKRYKKIEDREVKGLIESAPKNVLFLEYVEDIAAVYSGCDIFLFPSHCENQGIVILEASATQKPIILRDIKTYEGWMQDEVNCLMAKTDEEFLAQVKRLINDEGLGKRLAQNAYTMSREHSLELVGAQLKGIYEELLSK
jgi:1,2-diacylglycerol-3-alpha-glucose alpha-1,2-glucosyltransferase